MDNPQAQPPTPDPLTLQVLTNEYFNLQSARAGTISEANGRASLFLGAVSSTLIALGFVGNISDMGETFRAFVLIIFPILFFIGLSTFVRVLETSIEDLLYARGLNRIRHYFAEVAPAAKTYFVLPIADDWAGMQPSFGIRLTRGQILLTNATLIGVINSVITGVFVAIVMLALANAAISLSIVVGMITFFVSLWLHNRFQIRQQRAAFQRIKPMFPYQTDTDHA